LSLNRSEKEAVIEEVTGLAAKAQTLVMAEYRGITVADHGPSCASSPAARV
jgi:large subunit ribosomal protein L10